MFRANHSKWIALIGAVLILTSTVVLGGCSPNTYNEGVFVAVSEGDDRGFAEVSLTIENDEIIDIQITEYDGLGVEKLYETYGQRFEYMEEAHEYLSEEIIANNTWDVDVYSGATSTSGNVKQAARFAMEKALLEEPEQTYFDGTFMARSDGNERGWHIAWVTLENDEIVDVNLAGTTPVEEDSEPVLDEAGRQVFEMKDDDYPHDPFHEGQEIIAELIVDRQDTEVDVYSEATSSSKQWMEAVYKAKEMARTRTE